MSIKTLVK